ncbi:MAG: CD225/dispanin family protein [Actinomycetota bacterium]|nr:CD225/dispanin family protein [Actinomycetota bacterium]
MSELEQPLPTQGLESPRIYLWWAIAATAFCFAPFGIVAIWFGYRTLRAVDRNDLDAARKSSTASRRWLIVTVIVGLIINLTLLVIFGLMGAFST